MVPYGVANGGRSHGWFGKSLMLNLGATLLVVAAAHGQAPGAPSEGDFLSRVRRLTVEGRRAGEGYW
jgi:hypothetical protein